MTDFPLQNEELVADPFAADIFAARRAADAIAPERIGARGSEKPAWSDALPRVSASSARWDELLRRLPPIFFGEMSRALAQSLNGFLYAPDERATEFLPLDGREIDRAEDFAFSDSCWLVVGVEPSGAEIVFEIDDSLAARLVDAALGAEFPEGGQTRELTPSETAVLEFLALNLAHEANAILRTPLFRFRGVSRRIPDSLRQNLDSDAPALLTFRWRTAGESAPGVVRMHFALDALRALQPGENQLLAAETTRAAGLNVPRRIKDARARLRIGAAELSFAELAALETGDVILLENSGLSPDGADLFGRAEIFLGDAENAKISGELTTHDFAPGNSPGNLFEETDGRADNEILIRRPNSKDAWQVLITDLARAEIPAAPTYMTETDEHSTNEAAEENAGEVGLAAENIAVTVRVEIEARRLSLAEIGNLRENQILELGARPTDPVNLLIDDQKIGRGELVLVEDRLGVRITKLLR